MKLSLSARFEDSLKNLLPAWPPWTLQIFNAVDVLAARLVVQLPRTSAADLINPQRRCGCSDSPFTRIQYFYTARSRKGLERVDSSFSPCKIIKSRGLSPLGTDYPKTKKTQNWFAEYPSPILKRHPPFLSGATPFARYLAPLGTKYLKKRPKK